jgi:hypothetical protein
MFRTKIWVACCIGALVLAQRGIACADFTWDAVADFGSTNPSNSVWTYEWASSSAHGLDNLLDDKYEKASGVTGPNQLMSWTQQGVTDPCVVKNFTSSPITIPEWGVTVYPDKLFMYSGYASTSGQASVVKFTAPADGEYSVEASFLASLAGDNIRVMKNMTTLGNGTMLMQGSLDNGSSLPYSAVLSLSEGDTIAFCNAPGYPHNWESGGIDFAAAVTLVPEPTSIIMMVSGIFGLLAYAWRKRK